MMINSPHMQRPPSGGPMNSPQQVQPQPQPQNQQHPPPGYVYQKPGLRGGAPIHGFSRGAKRLPTASTSSAGQSQAPQTSNPVVIVTRSEGIIKELNNVTIYKKKPVGTMKSTGTLKAASGTRIIHRGKVANIIQQDELDETSNASTVSSPSTYTVQPHTMNRNLKRTVSDSCYTSTKSAMRASPMTAPMIMEDIVVIDSSPDEKQRIMDYDDDNDKSVMTEVSLSSVAPNAIDGDEVSVIYDTSAGNDFNIVSSPLESEEISEEYQLFPCVADYVDDGERHTIESPNEDDTKSLTVEDSDDDDKHGHSESPVYLDDIVHLDANSEEHFATTEEEIMSMNSEIIIMDTCMKTPDDRLHNATEDFEAMIDSGNSKDGKESNSSIELMEIEPDQELPPLKPSKPVTISKESSGLNKGRVITVVVPQSNASSTKPQIVSYSRKAIPATAMLTQKNAVYSTVTPSSSTHNLVKDATPAKYMFGNTTISVPILKNAIPLARMSGKNSAESTNKKIISQSAIISTSLANISGKKINTSNFVTLSPLSGGRIVQAQIVRAQPSQQTTTVTNQRKMTTISEPQITKSLPPTLTYSKIGSSLASLKVSQDDVLPQQIFQEESISPDSSIEQDESDIMLTEETIYTTEDSNQNNRDINDTAVSSHQFILNLECFFFG